MYKTEETKSIELFAAIEKRDIKEVVRLINAEADVNAVDKNGAAPLHIAAVKDNAETIKVLIEAGADVNKVENSGKTPLHYVATKNHTNICDIILNHIARLEIAGLYVSSSNSNKKRELISDSRNLHNDYLQYLENSRREVKKMEKENKPLYDFLKESDIAKLVSIFEKNEGVRSILDDQKGLRKQYSEYAYILISKANEVKKEIFLHNHKPLIDVLSKNYEKDFQKMSFVGIRNFFDVHRNDYRVKDRSISLINFVDLEDIATRNVPKLKVRALVEEIKNKVINSNLECPSTEQPQELNRAFN
uniref:Ankyrin repeat domain-containing protein n=1 Tax=Wolbachia endosymbiont of Oeneis ivallda TaxID=3171168 RepID=A0AAU7YJP5_9RICK